MRKHSNRKQPIQEEYIRRSKETSFYRCVADFIAPYIGIRRADFRIRLSQCPHHHKAVGGTDPKGKETHNRHYPPTQLPDLPVNGQTLPAQRRRVCLLRTSQRSRRLHAETGDLRRFQDEPS